MRDAAHQAGFNQSAFTRWKSGARADPEFVVKFARAFDLNVLEALVEAEFITEDEAGIQEISVGGPLLKRASSKQLTQEVQKRLDAAEQSALWPVPELGGAAMASELNSNKQDESLFDRNDLIARINSGEEQVAAQEATDPLEENQP